MTLDAGTLYLKILQLCMDKSLDLARDEPKCVFNPMCIHRATVLDK